MRNFYPRLAAAALLVGGLVSMTLAQDGQKPAWLDTSLSPEQRAAALVSKMTLEEKASHLVNQARAIPRLNVPAYDWWSESLHGVASQGITQYPEPVGLAATFDTPAIHEMAVAISTEARIKHMQFVKQNGGVRQNFPGGGFLAAHNNNLFLPPP